MKSVDPISLLGRAVSLVLSTWSVDHPSMMNIDPLPLKHLGFPPANSTLISLRAFTTCVLYAIAIHLQG